MSNSLILEDLYKVGTSAGGQRPKAIIGMDEPQVLSVQVKPICQPTLSTIYWSLIQAEKMNFLLPG